MSVGVWDAADEALVFGRYLVGRDIGEDLVALYVRGAEALAHEGDERERRIALFAVSQPWSLAAIDGALAVTQPRALLRRKLLLLTAILEASTEYCAEFLPAERSPVYALVVGWTLVRGAFAACAGLVLLRFVR
jgi:hypothetical protein